MACFFALQVTAQLPAQGTIFTSSCTLPNPNDTLIYEWDAKRLSMSRNEQLGTSYYGGADFHQPTVDSIKRVLYLIHNLQNSTLKDTLLNLFGFSNFQPNPYSSPFHEGDSLHIHHTDLHVTNANKMNYIAITLPNNIVWVSDWYNGNFINTSNTEINFIGNIPWLTKTVLQSGSNYRIIFSTNDTKKFNTLGLARRLLFIEPTSYATGIQNYPGDGNSIKLFFEPDGIKITYRNACGDCLLGCTYGRFWTFKTFYDNCSVQYIKDSSFNIVGATPPLVCLRPNSPTPVKFIDFFAKQNNNTTTLHWIMGEEVNFSHYEVEMSAVNDEFSAIGKVLPNAEKKYNYTIATPLYAATKFRIKAVDKDGSVMYSKQVEVKPTVSDKKSFIISPNPVTGRKLNIQSTSAQNGNYDFILLNTDGKKVFQQSIYIASGANAAIELKKNIISGIYIAQFITKDNKISLGKVVVQ